MDKKIDLVEYMMGRDKEYPVDEEMRISAQHLLSKVNELMGHFYKAHPESKRRYVTSGYRPAAINAQVANAAKLSHHQACRAVDILDTDRLLAKFCLANLQLLVDIGLWIEDPRWTKGKNTNWLHFQLVSPVSGKRVYVPSSFPALDPDLWDGKYDSKYDKKS